MVQLKERIEIQILVLKGNFNSLMVQLKEIITWLIACALTFQFLHGTIKTCEELSYIFPLYVFQFLHGTIKTCAVF